jgi:predicted transcriptional regulator
MRKRMALIRDRRAAGLGYRAIVAGETRPLVVELLSETARDLDSVGAQVRRAEARALHDEGMTMDEIARHFGVTRQRVSALLREARTAS